MNQDTADACIYAMVRGAAFVFFQGFAGVNPALPLETIMGAVDDIRPVIASEYQYLFDIHRYQLQQDLIDKSTEMMN